MRLVELGSNKESFNTLRFNRSGISIISAIRESEDQRKTYNSVGKSLSVVLIHFCLASSKIPDFSNKLKGWEFYLKFEIDGVNFLSKRHCENQDVISLDGEEMSLNKFRKEIEKKVFNLPESTKYLTFRSLISRFIRPYKSSYSKYDIFRNDEIRKPINILINNAFLLGIDVKLILDKDKLKSDLDKVDDFKIKISKDPIVKSFFNKEGFENLDIKIVELNSDVSKLESNIQEFNIADDYYKIKKEADRLVQELNFKKNTANKLRDAIYNIDRSIKDHPNVNIESVLDLYKEANIVFPDIIKRNLNEVENFHSKLLENRNARLNGEKKRFQDELNELDQEIEQIGYEKDKKLKYLNSHGALDEFTKLNEKITDLKIQLDKLKNYKNLLREYTNKQEELKQEFSRQNVLANKFLEETESLIERNIIIFKNLVDQFYVGKSAGISVENDSGINKTRFRISAKIQDDAGDAVNEVKVFCFDWTLLLGQHNHNMKFLFHDSRITDGMDTRQVKTMFEIAYAKSNKHNYQYIISMNQNVLLNLKNVMDMDSYKTIIEDNIVLTLSDKSDDRKLLGIQVDLKYEK